MKKARIAFIGAGDISTLHAEAIQNCENAELAGLWNVTRDLAEEKSRAFGCKIYSSAEELIKDSEIDAVFVLTNLETHRFYAGLALESGKHVFVEKPVGVSVKEIAELRDLAADRQLICMPGHNYIYEDSLQRSRRLIEAGKLGRIISAYVMYNIHHPEEVAARFPGVIRQIMTHHAYILLYLLGRPSQVMAMKSTLHYESISQEDLAMVTLRMKDDALVHFCASFASDDYAADPWTVLIKVIGEGGTTRYSYNDWVEGKPAVVHSHTYSAYQQTISNEVNYFVERCLGRGEAPLSTLDDAIAAQQIIEAAEASIEEGRVIDL